MTETAAERILCPAPCRWAVAIVRGRIGSFATARNDGKPQQLEHKNERKDTSEILVNYTLGD
jgi:hypothetical protein